MSGWTFDERFKAWAEREGMTLITPNNTLQVATSKDMEAAFLGGINSRDAEVQALREALRKIAWLDTGENSSHSDALDALTKIEVIAFAALAGGEKGKNDE